MTDYIGGNGSDFFQAKDFNNTLSSSSPQNDLLSGLGGDDLLFTGSGSDTALGGAGDDRIDTTFGGQASEVFANGSDTVVLTYVIYGSADVTVDAGTGADLVIASSGEGVFEGGTGFDVLKFSSPTFAYFGTDQESSRVRYSASWDTDIGISVDLVRQTATFAGVEFTFTADVKDPRDGSDLSFTEANFGQFSHKISGFEAVVGTAGSDTLRGSDGDDILSVGLGGSDKLFGRDGFDIASFSQLTGIYMGPGQLTNNLVVDLSRDLATYKELKSGATVTTVATVALGDIEGVYGSIGADRLKGDRGANTFSGGAGADTIDGAKGVDTVIYSADPQTSRHEPFVPETGSGVTVNLVSGLGLDAFGVKDVLIGIENVVGSNFDDRITGDGRDNVLEGRQGADRVSGGDGADVVSGGAGADTLQGGDGRDILSYFEETGGKGVALDFRFREGPSLDTYGDVDTFLFNSENGSFEVVYGSRWSDRIVADVANGKTQYGFDGDDTLASHSDSALYGGFGDDSLEGSIGQDKLFGEEDNDVLSGGGGEDTLEGGDGEDTLDGGSDVDLLRGGGGADVLRDVVGLPSPRELFELWQAARRSGVALDDRFIDKLKGEAGDDKAYGVGLVQGGEGGDTLVGAGILDGGEGDDRLVADTRLAEVGKTYAVLSGGLGNDTISRGDGAAADVIVSYGYSKIGVVVDLIKGSAHAGSEDVDRLIEVRNLWGSDYADDIHAKSATVNGFDGDDAITFMKGAVAFANGGEGEDRIRCVVSGAASLIGAEGADTIVVTSASGLVSGEGGNDVISAKTKQGLISGGDGDDTIDVTFLDKPDLNTQDCRVKGGDGADAITATLSIGEVHGDIGADVITVNYVLNRKFDAVEVYAGEGNDDVVFTQSGSSAAANVGSLIELGAGHDTLTAAGDNIFVVTDGGNDVMDFSFGANGRGGHITVVCGDGRERVTVHDAFKLIELANFNERADVLDISDITDKRSDTFSKIKAIARETDYGVRIELGESTIQLREISLADLNADMFIL